MMNNIFENAYFGKSYKTRDGRKARYCGKQASMFELELDGIIIDYFSDGSFYTAGESPLDIVSKWQEEINEEELDKLAKEATYIYSIDDTPVDVKSLYIGFRAGYRKAKENG